MSAVHTDIDFLNAIRANTREGYERIYQQYGSILYGIILKSVIEEQIAIQIFRDTMIEIWKRINEFEAAKMELLQWMTLRVLRPRLSVYRIQNKKQ